MNEPLVIPTVGKVLTQDGSRPWWVTRLVLGSAEVSLELYCESLPDHIFLGSATQLVSSLESSEEHLRTAVADDIMRHYGHMVGKLVQPTTALLANDMALKSVARWDDGDFLLTYRLAKLSFSNHRFVIGEFDANHRLSYTNLS